MGMDPFNFADALLGILAQRLARRLCARCRAPHALEEAEIDSLLSEYCTDMIGPNDDPESVKSRVRAEWLQTFARDGRLMINAPKGCPDCEDSGYRGRIALHELLVGTDAIKRLIQERARVAEVRYTAISEGMRTLKQDGIEKVLQGLTDMREVRAVCVK
jgi:type II secretory ATPase GspE/PulE/Tfp pilus assembly ATPase PilB-like protein